MHRHHILSTLAMAAGLTAVYYGLIGVAHLVYALGWYAGAPA